MSQGDLLYNEGLQDGCNFFHCHLNRLCIITVLDHFHEYQPTTLLGPIIHRNSPPPSQK